MQRLQSEFFVFACIQGPDMARWISLCLLSSVAHSQDTVTLEFAAKDVPLLLRRPSMLNMNRCERTAGRDQCDNPSFKSSIRPYYQHATLRSRSIVCPGAWRAGLQLPELGSTELEGEELPSAVLNYALNAIATSVGRHND